MAKVIQIRGVPDDVHAKLAEAAEKAGRSLTEFLRAELVDVSERVDPVGHNRRVIEKLRAEIGVIEVPRGAARRILEQGREERTQSLLDGHRRQRKA